jgi:hypothetical protein
MLLRVTVVVTIHRPSLAFHELGNCNMNKKEQMKEEEKRQRKE